MGTLCLAVGLKLEFLIELDMLGLGGKSPCLLFTPFLSWLIDVLLLTNDDSLTTFFKSFFNIVLDDIGVSFLMLDSLWRLKDSLNEL